MEAPTDKARVIETDLRRRGWITNGQTLHDWATARRAEGHSVQQIVSLIWSKSAGQLYVSERSLRTWYPDLTAPKTTKPGPEAAP